MSKQETTRTNKEYWSFVRETAKEVESWPGWMKGEAACGDKSNSSDQAQNCTEEAGKCGRQK